MRLRPAALLLLLLPSPAAARAPQPPGELRLVGGALTPRVESWGAHCGPAPPATERDAPGATYRLGADGTLAPAGGARPLFGPGICAGATGIAGLHERRPRADRFQCASAPGSGKSVRGEVRLQAADGDRFEVTHAFDYDWKLQGSHCVVRVEGRWTLARSAPRAAPAPCAAPGPPTRLQAVGRTARAVRPGGRLRLDVRAEDARGCPVGARPVWTASAGEVDAEGAFTARGLAHGARATVTAALDAGAGASAAVVFTVGVVDPGAADALDEAALLAALPDLPTAAVASLSPETAQGVAVRSGAAAPGDRPLRARVLRYVFVTFATVAALLGLHIAWRTVGGRRRALPGGLASAGAASPDTESAGHAARSVGPTATVSRDDRMMAGDTGSGEGRVCPRCGTRYGDDARFCGRDGAALDPLT